jgi:hypothetical protein
MVDRPAGVDVGRSHPLGRPVAPSGDVPKVVFRIPTPALLAAGLATIGATPFAWAAPGLQAVYLLPAAFAVWVVRNRTTVDGERLVARSTFGRREVAWADVKAIKVTPRGWLSAALADGSLVRLPAVRAGHLPALAAVSGGRIPDPNAAPAAREEEPEAADGAGEEADAEVKGPEVKGAEVKGAEAEVGVAEAGGSTAAGPVADQEATPPPVKSQE